MVVAVGCAEGVGYLIAVGGAGARVGGFGCKVMVPGVVTLVAMVVVAAVDPAAVAAAVVAYWNRMKLLTGKVEVVAD